MRVEQLVSTALNVAAKTRPDVVEANYLVPYASAAYIVSKILDIPLLLRHAGSDLAKLVQWPPATRSLIEILSGAHIVVSPPDVATQLPIPPEKRDRVISIRRYVADPRFFALSDSLPLSPTILYAGKLGYYWRLKAVDTLVSALALRPNWNLVVVADGKGLQTVQGEVARAGLMDRVTWHGFVSPDAMPMLLSQVTAVWAAERQGGVPEFSNIMWESLAVGRPCLVSSQALLHAEAAAFRECSGLLVVDPEDPQSVIAALDRAILMGPTPPPPNIQADFDSYTSSNLSAYLSALRGL